MGVVAFVEAHKDLPGDAEGLAGMYQAMATAAEIQPVPARTRANLQMLADMQRQVAALAALLYEQARQGNAGDYDKAENPRGGTRTIEKKGDVTTTAADGF